MKKIFLVGLFIISLCVFLNTLEEETNLYYTVSISGAVHNPGIYEIPPSTRLSKLFKMARPFSMNDSINICLQPENFNQKDKLITSLRNIILERDNKKREIDIKRFFILGEDGFNPLLEDGDKIIVQSAKKFVSLYGAVENPGSYEIVTDDKLSDIIQFAFGFKKEAYKEEIEIIRFLADGVSTTTKIIDYTKITDNTDSEENLFLKNGDRIYVRSKTNFHDNYYVLIRGEVKYPGRYAIKENETTLLDIINRAGGTTEQADLQNAYMQRKKAIGFLDKEFERLKKMNIEDMTELEYAYFKAKSREMKGKISIDFEKLLNSSEKKYNITLKNKDYIYFPNRSYTVSVTGNVKNPGLITYIPGKNFYYYIKQAGGYSWNVRKNKIRVIRAQTGEWVDPDETTKINLGDMIFVPEKPERDYWEITK